MANAAPCKAATLGNVKPPRTVRGYGKNKPRFRSRYSGRPGLRWFMGRRGEAGAGQLLVQHGGFEVTRDLGHVNKHKPVAYFLTLTAVSAVA